MIDKFGTPELWQIIHGSIGFADLEPAVNRLNKIEIAYFKSKGIDVGSIFYVERSLNPYVYVHRNYVMPIYPTAEIFEQLNLEQKIKLMSAEIDDMLKSKEFDKFFAIQDKKFIIDTYIRMFEEIPIESRYDIFVDVWTRAETGFERFTPEILMKIFQTRTLSDAWRERMTSLGAIFNERAKNGKITIWHGEQNREYNPGDICSWTLRKDVAEFFAYRFNNHENGTIHRLDVTIDKCIDFLEDRNEDEILYVPDNFGSRDCLPEPYC